MMDTRRRPLQSLNATQRAMTKGYTAADWDVYWQARTDGMLHMSAHGEVVSRGLSFREPVLRRAALSVVAGCGGWHEQAHGDPFDQENRFHMLTVRQRALLFLFGCAAGAVAIGALTYAVIAAVLVGVS